MATRHRTENPSTSSLHSGTPTGRIEQLHGLNCYIADAPRGVSTANGIVVIIPAASGWQLPNNRVLADHYARQGNFQVYLPDFMDGVVVPEDVQTSFKAMKKTSIFVDPIGKLSHLFYVLRCMLPFVYYCRPALAGPRISAFLRSLKQHEGRHLPIGVAGFAWGGYFAIRACWDQQTNRTNDGAVVVECGHVAHPSNTKFPEDVERIARPISWAAAEMDRHMSAEAATLTERILERKAAREDGITHEFVMYRGVHYGFAQGSDRKKAAEAEAGEQAARQAVDWFVRRFDASRRPAEPVV